MSAIPPQPSKLIAKAARTAVLTLALLAGMAPIGHTAPGQMDMTFAGVSATSLGLNVMCHAVASDGKIVLAGNSGSGLVVARRHPNGDPDYSFGGDGNVVVTNPSYPMEVRSVAVQTDGRIVLAGYGNTGFQDFLVIRLTASGALDATFSGDGFVTTSISGFEDYAEKVLIQPDGKIVVVGRSILAGDWDFSVARFHTNGTLDVNFSGDGRASIGFGGDDECYDAVLQADGKLVMVGHSEDFNFLDQDFAVARLHPDGSLDGSWDGDGKLKTGFGDVESARSVAIQPSDLRIVVTGSGKVARYYSSDGALDNSFDGDGKLSISIHAYDVAITPAGKLTFIGLGGGAARLLRLNANGSQDAEFSNPLVESSAAVEPPSLSLLADGRVLAVAPKGSDCAIRRYWQDGDLDIGGRQLVAWNDVTFPPGSQEFADDVAIQSDGKIVVVGYVSTPGNTETDFAVARLLPDGNLDDAFGVHGRATLSLGNSDYAKAVAIQPDGKIVVAGYTGVGNATNFMIARFTASGVLDNTFGFGGFNALDFMGGPDFGWAIALQPDGKILVAGTVSNGARSVYGVARFNGNGTVDNTFDLDGKQLVEFSVGPSHWASAVVVTPAGRIIVGGSVNRDFALVALTPTGAIDTNFGTSGKTIRNLGGDDYLEALVIGENDRIYAAGTRVVSGNADWALARWPANGGLWLCVPVCPWTSAFVDFGATSGWIDDLDVRSDGHMVLAGFAGNVARWAHFSPGNTTPDATGQATFPGNATMGLGVRFAGANQIVLAGAQAFQNDRNMTVARFETVPNTAVDVEEPLSPSPSQLLLHAPWPNPIVNRSMFAFDLPRAESVKLAIHDVSGRRVRVLMEGAMTAGRHQWPWDGSDDQGRAVAAGRYYVRLDAGTEHARRTVVVLR